MRISENLQNIRENIAAAARRARRDPGEIRLIVVTKNRPVEAVEEVLAAGVRDIGENRVQEFSAKYAIIGGKATWHLIGNLQRNKVAKVVGEVELIHSVDSLELAEAVSKRASQLGVEQQVLLEVNVSGEETKHGLTPEALDRFIERISGLPGLDVRGLMTVAPLVADPEEARPVFKRLAALRDELKDRGYEMPDLSMGMTNDYEVAVEEGATMVRIGTAVFSA